MKNSLYILLVLIGCLLAAHALAQPCRESDFVEKTKALFLRGEFEQAGTEAQRGLNCATQNANEQARFTFLLLKYEALRNGRKNKKAFAAAQECAVFLKKKLVPDDRLALLTMLAEANSLVNDSTACWRYLKQALDLAKHPPPPPRLAAWLQFVEGNASFVFQKNQAFAAASFRSALQRCLTMPEPDVFLQGQLLRWLGNFSRSNGDFQQSLLYYQRELALYKRYYPPSQPDAAICHYNHGNVHYELLDFDSALVHYQLCLEVWKVIFKPENPYMRYLYEAMGDIYWEKGNRKLALDFYDRSIAGEPPPSRDSALIFKVSADTLFQKGKLAGAFAYYQRALDFRERHFGKDHPMTAACQNFIAKAHQRAGHPEDALAAFRASVAMFDGNNHNDGSHYLLEALAGQGELLLERFEKTGAQADLKAAFESLQLALRHLEAMRRSPMSEAAKQFWTRRSSGLLEKNLVAALHLHRLTGDNRYAEIAFSTAEKSKAFLLLAAVQDADALSFSGVPDSLIKEERRLKKSLLDYDGKIAGEERRCAEARQKQIELWREKRLSLQLAHDHLLDRFRQEYPAYFDLKYNTETVTLASLQKQLPGDGSTALLEFFEGQKQVFLFLVTRKRLQVFQIRKDPAFTDAVNSLTRLLTSRDSFIRQPEQAYRGFIHSARFLYKQLLEMPLANCSSGVNRLLIVPDGSLFGVPFECLLASDPAAGAARDYRQLDYLVRRFSVTYSPSATLWLLAGKDDRFKKRDSYLGFAPGYEGRLALRFSENEIADGASIFNGKSLTGAAATERAFRQSSGQPGILHLACHAFVEDARPLLSRLLLAAADSSEDGNLHAFELYGLRMPTRLAVLSACQTAAGRFERGEGLMSLERCFQYAGCSSLLTTFWTADDASAAAVVGYFLKNLKTGMPKDEALRQAQLEYLNTADPASASPWFWAGFRFTGDPSPLGGRSYALPFAALLAGSLAGLFFWKKYRKRLDG